MNYTYESMIHTYDHISSKEGSQTKTRILDAAECLFAERGYDATSLRAITAKAGVNLAAVNYHFRSKEALLQAVLARRLQPLSRLRLELLDSFETEAGDGPVPLEKILRAGLEPIFRLAAEPDSGWGNFRRLFGQMYTAPRIQALALREIDQSVQRLRAALHRACPDLSMEDLTWKMGFVVGAMAHALAAGPLPEIASERKCDPHNLEHACELLIRFASGGFAAGGDECGRSKTGDTTPLRTAGASGVREP
jgi:AcrR family transcriptional regulator